MRFPGGEEFELRIVALSGEAPSIVRLRRVLKGLLRAHNFRCTSCRDVTPPGKVPMTPEEAEQAMKEFPF